MEALPRIDELRDRPRHLTDGHGGSWHREDSSLIEFISISKGRLGTTQEDKPALGAEKLAEVPTCPGKGTPRQGTARWD